MKIKDDHVIIETAGEAACFRRIIDEVHISDIDGFSITNDLGDYESIEPTVSFQELKEAITAKPGEAVFGFFNSQQDDASPLFSAKWNGKKAPDATIVCACALTTTTVGQLRQLLKIANEEDD